MYTIVLGVKRGEEGEVLDEQVLERFQQTKKLHLKCTIHERFYDIR